MGKSIRRNHAPAFKTKVALEAIKEQKTIAELTSLYGVHATQITKWKKTALESLSQGFSEKKKPHGEHDQELIQELYQQIGKLKVEGDFLKKKMGIFGE